MTLLRVLRQPFRDLMAGLEAMLAQGGGGALARVFAGLTVGWWLYVPVHELLHAAGCWLGGGSVERLEISPLYGGAVLARWLAFVEPGGAYAGRLAGFDDGGSDAVYALTVFAPYVLTLFPGVWLLLRAGQRRRAWLWGLALPMALAPLLSVLGDAYELGSIVITQVPPWSAPEIAAALRGDDLLLKLGSWAGGGPKLWLGGLLAALVGAAWAFATYGLGRALARSARLGHRAPAD